MQGITEGFRIGFDYSGHSCQKTSTNLVSATAHPKVVDDYLGKEGGLGRIAELADPAGVPLSQVSPFGVIPKRDPGAQRLIVDLSYPAGE